MNLDKKLIKKTHIKVVLSGNMIESYTYEKPLFYNYPTIKTENSLTTNNNPNNERSFFSIKRSRDKIRRLCNANVDQYGKNIKPKFLTLTFKENIIDLHTARLYFKLFNQRLQYQYPNTKYLGVAEIQKKRYEKYGHKVWHFHVIYFNLPYIHGIKKTFNTLWPHGITKINAIDHVRNTGAYVSKYLRKDLYEPELYKQKSFFCSKQLIQPKTFRNNLTSKKILQKSKTSLEYTTTYPSNTHGNITYTVYKIEP